MTVVSDANSAAYLAVAYVFAVVLLVGYLGWSLRKLRQLERVQKGSSISGLPPKQ